MTPVYVYAVAATGDAPTLPQGGPSLDERFPLELVESGGLVALTSEIELGPFDRGVAAARDGDLTWLERAVRGHAEVLGRADSADALLPFRFGTVLADRDEVRTLLRSRADTLREQLEALRGTREWGVKALVDREQLETAIAADAPMLSALSREASAGDGKAFFARKLFQRELDERLIAAIAVIAGVAHERLVACARDAVLNRPQSPGQSGLDGEMILNGAYLVERTREPELHGAVEELRGELGPDGVSFAVTGPWSPFSFVREEAQAE